MAAWTEDGGMDGRWRHGRKMAAWTEDGAAQSEVTAAILPLIPPSKFDRVKFGFNKKHHVHEASITSINANLWKRKRETARS